MVQLTRCRRGATGRDRATVPVRREGAAILVCSGLDSELSVGTSCQRVFPCGLQGVPGWWGTQSPTTQGEGRKPSGLMLQEGITLSILVHHQPLPGTLEPIAVPAWGEVQ